MKKSVTRTVTETVAFCDYCGAKPGTNKEDWIIYFPIAGYVVDLHRACVDPWARNQGLRKNDEDYLIQPIKTSEPNIQIYPTTSTVTNGDTVSLVYNGPVDGVR